MIFYITLIFIFKQYNMNTYKKFLEIDLVEGKNGEKVVLNYLIEKGFQLIKENDDYRYDLEMSTPDGSIQTYEVKRDKYICSDSIEFNLYIEFNAWYKPSGIKTTKSDWYCYYIPNKEELWFIKTSVLKQLINDEDEITIKDCNYKKEPTKGYLIPTQLFKQHFLIKKIKNENKLKIN